MLVAYLVQERGMPQRRLPPCQFTSLQHFLKHECTNAKTSKDDVRAAASLRDDLEGLRKVLSEEVQEYIEELFETGDKLPCSDPLVPSWSSKYVH